MEEKEDNLRLRSSKAKTKNERLQILSKRFVVLKINAYKFGVDLDTTKSILRGNKKQDFETKVTNVSRKTLVIMCIVALAFTGVVLKREKLRFRDFSESSCLVEPGEIFMTVTRPRTNCDICRNVSQVAVEYNLSPERFSRLYAFTAAPVLVKNATANWTAMNTFSFSFFKSLYYNYDGSLDYVLQNCEFFPYKTEFEDLAEVFRMSKDRASFKHGEKPWYIGWSNCHNEVAKVLRQHYERPYFIPKESESSSIDWIFMGGSGLGAFIHLDYVQRPSWQAQILGKKTWTIIPTPECEHVCSSMNVTVSKGDILVIDTNQWYHATYIHPGEISITIGSEYD